MCLSRCIVPVLLSAVLLLNGCGSGKFFTPETGDSGGGSGGGGNTTGSNYLFVANAGANSVAGFAISSTGTLGTLNGAPINFNFTPTALTVSRDNKYLWVGTVSQIFGFSIASDGTLTALNSGSAIANAFCSDMQVSPDGKWLMVLDGSGNGIDLFAIGSDGSLTLGPNGGVGFTVPTGTVVPKQLRISPTGSYVIAAMGTAGELYFNFNTTTGLLQYVNQTSPPGTTSDNAIAIDSTGTYVYEARSGTNPGLVVNTISSSGLLVPTTSTSYPTGTQPYSVVLDNTGKYVYVANRGDNTISGWSIGTSAALTAISGSPFASGVAVTSLGADSTGKYIAAAAYSGSPDVTLYGFDTTTAGALTSVATSATGTNASIVALSH